MERDEMTVKFDEKTGRADWYEDGYYTQAIHHSSAEDGESWSDSEWESEVNVTIWCNGQPCGCHTLPVPDVKQLMSITAECTKVAMAQLKRNLSRIMEVQI